MNQSEFLVITSNMLKLLEKLHVQGIIIWLYFWQSFKDYAVTASLQYKGWATRYATVKSSLIRKINVTW